MAYAKALLESEEARGVRFPKDMADYNGVVKAIKEAGVRELKTKEK